MVSPGRSPSLVSRVFPAPRCLAPRRGGFTLVEILVVLAIIAILAAIILPAIANSQRSALAANSVSNLKQWHVGFSGAVGENDNSMPSDGSGQFKISDETAWFNRMPPHIKVAPLDNAGSDMPQMRQKSVWINPGAPTKSLGTIPFCYGFNDYLSTANEPTMKLTRVVFPSKTILMAEKLPNSEPAVNPGNIRSYYAQKDENDPDAVCNILFVDGHVEGVKHKIYMDSSTVSAGTEDDLRVAPLTWQPYEGAQP